MTNSLLEEGTSNYKIDMVSQAENGTHRTKSVVKKYWIQNLGIGDFKFEGTLFVHLLLFVGLLTMLYYTISRL